MDTNTRSSEPPKPWALWAALVLVAAGALALVYVLFVASSKPEASGGLMRFARGEMQRLVVMDDAPPMPTRTLRDAAGAEVTLAQLAGGEVAVVNLWATWCAPCKREMPTLATLQQRFQGRIRVLPISADDESKLAEAQAELARLSNGVLPFAIDTSRGVLFDSRAPGLPVTIIYGRDGREIARVVGDADWDGEDAAALIEAVLAGEGA